MTEQIDLFESVNEPEEEQKEEPKSELTPRQWALYRLIKYNSLVEHRKTTQKEICDKLGETFGYKWVETSGENHDHCSTIWKDIKDNNESYEHDKIIISKNYEYWIGNEEETQEFLNELWNNLCPRLVRYWNYKQKVARNGQGQLFSTKLNPIDENSKAREFIESYNDHKIS